MEALVPGDVCGGGAVCVVVAASTHKATAMLVSLRVRFAGRVGGRQPHMRGRCVLPGSGSKSMAVLCNKG